MIPIWMRLSFPALGVFVCGDDALLPNPISLTSMESVPTENRLLGWFPQLLISSLPRRSKDLQYLAPSYCISCHLNKRLFRYVSLPVLLIGFSPLQTRYASDFILCYYLCSLPHNRTVLKRAWCSSSGEICLQTTQGSRNSYCKRAYWCLIGSSSPRVSRFLDKVSIFELF